MACNFQENRNFSFSPLRCRSFTGKLCRGDPREHLETLKEQEEGPDLESNRPKHPTKEIIILGAATYLLIHLRIERDLQERE